MVGWKDLESRYLYGFIENVLDCSLHRGFINILETYTAAFMRVDYIQKHNLVSCYLYNFLETS